MCGIAGFFGKGSEVDVKKMIATVPYRGPDATEVYFNPDHHIGLAHARLAIIDLTSSGLQPMWNNAKTVVIVFNGEIYNFAAIKKELELGGYRFVGTSDTEVILALYEKEGEECFARLDGMFAIALFDTKANRLILARDRMGKKPLYWSMVGETCVFGSEPKTLLAHPEVRPEVDLSALNMYLANDFVPTPFSIYKGIAKLEPGSYLVVEGGKTRLQSFWAPEWNERAISEEEAKKALDQVIAHAVEERLVSDVPLGVFLSGGLDSSTVAWYAAQTRKNIDTFAIGFEEASFDESSYARDVAKLLGTTHHERILSATDALAIIPEIYARLDEPMADASIIPTTLLSKFARESVTVALGGDGGDELFAGYPTFQAERAARAYQIIPGFLRQGISRGVHALPPSYSNFSLEYKLKKFLDGADVSEMSGRHMRWLGTFGDDLRSQLLSPSVREALTNEDPYAFASRRFMESAAPDDRNKLLFMYQRTYMMDEVMVKVDRASMYASLEARAPLLSREVVELANQLPYRYKLHGLTTKYLLKELMRGRLPDAIIDRPKKGFGVPTGAWLRGPLRDWAEDLLSEKSLNRENLFDMTSIARLKNDHMEGHRDNRKELWNLIVFALWQNNWLK